MNILENISQHTENDQMEQQINWRNEKSSKN